MSSSLAQILFFWFTSDISDSIEIIFTRHIQCVGIKFWFLAIKGNSLKNQCFSIKYCIGGGVKKGEGILISVTLDVVVLTLATSIASQSEVFNTVQGWNIG